MSQIVTAYQIRLARSMSRQARIASPKISVLLTRFYERASSLYSVGVLIDQLLLSQELARLLNPLVPAWLAIGSESVRLIMKRLNKASPDLERVDAELLSEYLSLLPEKMSGVAETTIEQIQSVITKGIDEGLPRYKIAEQIAALSSFARARGELIARTELHGALNYAHDFESERQERVLGEQMFKKWLPAGDERTRPNHLAMSTKPIIPRSELFTVGSSRMAYPGDSRGGASEVINCRCTLISGTARVFGMLY